MENLILKSIKELIGVNPNDKELGKKIRRIFNSNNFIKNEKV